jgi:hypothetical protein
MHLYLDGVHVFARYRDKGRNFYFMWREARQDFYTYIRLLSRIASTVVSTDALARGKQ